MGTQQIVRELANRTLLLVHVRRNLRTGRQVANQVLERSLGVRRVMEDLIAGDEVEETRAKRQPPEIGLNEMSIGHRTCVLIGKFDALAQIDSEYLSVRVLRIQNRVSSQPGSGIQDETFGVEKLSQPLDGLESVSLQVPVDIHRPARRFVTEVRNAFPLSTEAFLSLLCLLFECLAEEETRHTLPNRVLVPVLTP